MAQGFPPPEGWEEGDHAHTPWVGVKWGFPRREGQRSCLPSYLPYRKRMGVTMATLTHSSREEGKCHDHLPTFLIEQGWGGERSKVMVTMAQDIPPPEGWGKGDHTHTPWVGVMWGFPRREGQRSCLLSYLPYPKGMGVTMATLTHSSREEGQRS